MFLKCSDLGGLLIQSVFSGVEKLVLLADLGIILALDKPNFLVLSVLDGLLFGTGWCLVILQLVVGTFPVFVELGDLTILFFHLLKLVFEFGYL